MTMSEEQLNGFLETAKSDNTLQDKLKVAADANAVVSIAREAGFSILAEEFQSAMDDAELENAAGGCQVNSAALSFPPYCRFPHEK